MYPLDVTMPQAGCCVAGGLEFGAGIDPRIGIGAGAPACLGRQACSCPSHSDVYAFYRTPGAKRVWNFASSGGRAPC